jgi:hypothetical protein
MTHVDLTPMAAPTPTLRTLAHAGAATLLAAAAPAISFLPALTTNIHGSGAAVTFPHGYPVILAVTIVVTTVACTLGALTAKRAGLVAIPLGLAWWALIGFALTTAGVTLGHHAALTGWGIALLAATLAGAAVGLPFAARR